VALTLLFIAVVAAPLAAQGSGIDFVSEPAPGSQTAGGGGYFLIRTEPGHRLEQSLSLRNDSNQRLALRLAAVDATTGPLGGVSYRLETEPPWGLRRGYLSKGSR
jgi:hypothetical protein